MSANWSAISDGALATPSLFNDRLDAFRKGDVFNVKAYGATGDGSTDDGAAIQLALTAALAVNGTVFFPPGTYLVDQEFYVTASCGLRGVPGSIIKLKSNSALFNDHTNPYGRYIFHIRSGNVTIKDLYFDGNSRNNSFVSGGVTYYNASNYSVGIMIVGWYNAAGTSDIEDIEIGGCTFYDAVSSGLDSFMQGFTNVIRRYSVHDCKFWYTQGVQLVFSNCEDSIAYGNKHYQSYFAPFQFYYSCVNCSYDGNTVRFKSSTIDITKVDPGLKSGSSLTQGSQVRLGKDSAHPNTGCSCINNKIYGGKISALSGLSYSEVKNNFVYASETVGIECAGANMGKGNIIAHNTIVNCDQPGLYLDNVPYEVIVEGNRLWGNCTKTLSTTYGNRQLDCQIVIWDKDYTLRRNMVRLGDGSVPYGVLLSNTTSSQYLVDLKDNDFRGSGATADIGVNTGVWPPVLTTNYSYISDLQSWDFQSASFGNNGTLDSFPAGVNGLLLMQCGTESGWYAVTTSGGSTTCTLITGSSNAVATDTNAKACVFSNSNTINFRNRLGAAYPVTIKYFYR